MFLLVYTLGSSNRTIEDFNSILQKFKIQALVGVRRFPVSKFEHFKKDSLATNLQKEGIKYFYLGDVLGGFREKGYEEYTHTVEFREGIEKLKEIASEFTTVLLCAEKFPWRCHRRLIAQRLVQDDWRVIHILDVEKTWEPKNKPVDFNLNI